MVALILGLFFSVANLRAQALETYQGTDQGKPCFLYVHNALTESLEASNDTGYRVEVSTSYEHAGQGLGKVILTFVPDSEGKTLEWKSESGEEFLRVVLQAPNKTLEAPGAFRVKWLHFDHLHDAICKELRKVGS